MPEHSESLEHAAVPVATLAAERAADMAEDRRLGRDVVKAITDAGFLRHFVPTGFGGPAGTFTDLLPAVATIGARCAATAWCASLFACTTRFLSCFPAELRAEVWVNGPDAAVVGSVIPFGTAVAGPDGLRVSGRWPYLSGVEFADWLILCVRVTAPLGSADTSETAEPELKLVAVPGSACQVEDTWFSVGMQASGSNTAVLHDVPVPPHRICDRADLFAGRAPDQPDQAARPTPLPAVNGLTFVVPAYGAARGALRLLTEHLAPKLTVPRQPGVPGPPGNQATYEQVLARSAAELDAAGLLLGRIAAVADRGCVTPAETVRAARDSAYTIELLRGTVNRIFHAAGTSGQRSDGPLQRFWRDVNSVATHQALQFEPVARQYAVSLAEAPQPERTQGAHR